MLASRIHKAKHSRPAAAPSVVLPVDVVHDYLKAHPVVVHQFLTAQSVHAAILDLIRMDSSTPPPPATAPPAPLLVCSECHKGRPVLDMHRGEDVCDHCGVVFLRRHMSAASFSKDEPPVEKTAGRSQIRGVSQLVIQTTTPPNDQPPFPHLKDLEHWNQFTHYSGDTLRDMDRVLQKWTKGAHSRAARLTAVLLKTHVAAMSNVSLRQHERVRVVETAVPRAKFACATCGHRVHTSKDARFHCKRSVYGSR